MELATARRIALAAQGFADPLPTKVTVRHFRRALDRMKILQLDSVNVIARSHFLPMLARLGPYDRDRLDAWLWRSGENFEFLAHEASVTPAELFPLLAHRFGSRWQSAARLAAEQPDYLRAVYAEIEEHGALSVSDLRDPGRRTGPWWGNPKGKVALNGLFWAGEVLVANRSANFVTEYDLPHRVLPGEILDRPPVPRERAERELVLLAARALGIGTAADIADYFRIGISRVRPILADLVADGALRTADVRGWADLAYLDPAARRPRRIDRRALLSPFDPLVWFRPRALRLFDFDYRIEIYTPAAKRRHGYYVLPFLLGERLAARVDLKADRKAGALVVRSAFGEDGLEPGVVSSNLAMALHEMAGFLDLDVVRVERRGDLAVRLAEHV